MLANGIISSKTAEALPVGNHKRLKQEEKEKEEEVEEKDDDAYTPSEEEEESKGEESQCEVDVTMDLRVVLSAI